MRKSSRILHIILTCIISFLVFYYVTSDFLDSHFQGLYVIEPLLYLLILFGQTLIFYSNICITTTLGNLFSCDDFITIF